MDEIFRIKLERFANIPELPAVVYARGNLQLLDIPGVAIVGSRKSSAVGIGLVKEEISKIPEGFSVISGLAVGIDAEAHAQALAIRKPTIAVLPLGVGDESIFPIQNRALARKILDQGGLLLSIYKEGDVAQLEAKYFLERNAVIAALAYKVVGIEARERSGTLSTLRRAHKYGKEVWVNYQGENKVLPYENKEVSLA